MPNPSLSVSVDLTIYSVSCPGVFLKDRDDCFLEICLFGKHTQTQSVPPMFPLFFNERFKFHKVFYSASNPLELCALLKEESVMIEVVQKSPYIHAGVVLASIEMPVQDFLFPYPTAVPVYSGVDREILLSRSMHFDGLSPKLEFSSQTSVNSVLTTASDQLRDCVSRINNDDPSMSRSFSSNDMGPGRSLSRSKSLSSISRARDPSPTKPPFVVRKIDDNLLKSPEPLAATIPKKKRAGRPKKKKAIKGTKARAASASRQSDKLNGIESEEDVGIEYSPESSGEEEPITTVATRPYSSAPYASRKTRLSSEDSLIDSDWPAVPSAYESLIEKLERKRLLYEIERESRLARLRDPLYYPGSRYYLDAYEYELELAARRRRLERELDLLSAKLRRPLLY